MVTQATEKWWFVVRQGMTGPAYSLELGVTKAVVEELKRKPSPILYRAELKGRPPSLDACIRLYESGVRAKP